MPMRILSLILTLVLVGCGGGSSAPIPEAQAATPSPDSACPAGDATAQLQAMVDSAKGRLDLPACVFNTSGPIVISKPLRLTGSSATVDGTIIRSSADEAVVIDPAVRIAASSGFNKRGYWFSVENLRIEPAVAGGGRHGLVVRVRPGFFVNNWLVDRVHLGGFGEQGLYLDNTANNRDGIFSGIVSRSFIENGVLGVQIGDSVQFLDNIVPNRAPSPGQVFPGFDLSFVPGAAESSLVRNNITTTGGAIVIRNGVGVGLEHNWCEGASSAPVIQLINCLECTVRDNRVNTLGGESSYALVIDGGSLNAIDSNKLGAGKQGHIAFLNGSANNKLTGLNRFDGSPAGKITNAATGLLP